MLNCDLVRDALRTNVSLVAQCETVAPGILRIATQFRYPDGSHVDLFLDQRSPAYALSDQGEAAAYLLELGIRLWESRKRRNFVLDVCRTLRIQQEGTELRVPVSEEDQRAFADAVLRLAQACIRISDIAFTLTHRSIVSDFREQVEDFIEQNQFHYKADHTELGEKGNEVRLDFRVDSPKRITLVQALTAANESSGRHQAESVFAKWYDIRAHRNGQKFLTVCDSSVEAFQNIELRRIQDFSALIRFPANEQGFLEALAG